MSLINLLRKKSKVAGFTTPSHSQSFFIYPKISNFYKLDISETDAHNPQEALNKAQKRAAEIYKTKHTHFLTNGSSSGIIAAILCCTKPQDKVLIWDNAHPSHLNALKLSGTNPIFYNLDKNEDWGIFDNASPKMIEEKLKNEKIKAVIITSPGYEGVVSDIKSISAICKKLGAYLIVDEAHGALYPFSDDLPISAIYSGADFVIQSLHKTAGGLNPTALLHTNCELDPQDAIDMISTTSPSYPLLASIEKNINYLNSSKGRKKLAELVKNIKEMKQNLSGCEFFTEDITKIVVKIKDKNGFELSEKLFESGIEDEKTNEKSVMLLCGIGTEKKKLDKLEKVLKKLPQ